MPEANPNSTTNVTVNIDTTNQVMPVVISNSMRTMTVRMLQTQALK